MSTSGFWYLDGFDKVGEVSGFVIRHSNETDWLFFPSKWRHETPQLVLDIVRKLNVGVKDND